MSTTIAKNYQIGADGTASNNFTWRQPATPDGTVRLANGNTGSTTDLVTVNSSGNVGIGTSSPSTVLNAVGSTTFNGITNGSSLFQAVKSNTAADAGVMLGVLNGNSPYIAATALNNGTGTATPLLFYTASTERMRIDSAGNVGIGTSSPGCSLQVNGGIRTRGGAPGSGGVNNNGYAFSGNGGDTDGGMFSSADGQLEFYANSAERMRLNSDGNLQVGYSASTGSRIFSKKDGQGDWNNRSITIEDNSGGGSQPGIGFHAAGTSTAAIFKMYGPSNNFECRNAADNGFVGILASAFTPSSDYRVKTDVVEVETALQGVMSLRPVNYIKEGVNGREHGFIAHEVSPHFPDLVRGEKDAVRENGQIETQSLDYMGLTSVLVKAIQEQQALIAQLQADVAALKAG